MFYFNMGLFLLNNSLIYKWMCFLKFRKPMLSLGYTLRRFVLKTIVDFYFYKVTQLITLVWISQYPPMLRITLEIHWCVIKSLTLKFDFYATLQTRSAPTSASFLTLNLAFNPLFFAAVLIVVASTLARALVYTFSTKKLCPTSILLIGYLHGFFPPPAFLVGRGMFSSIWNCTFFGFIGLLSFFGLLITVFLGFAP